MLGHNLHLSYTHMQPCEDGQHPMLLQPRRFGNIHPDPLVLCCFYPRADSADALVLGVWCSPVS